MRGKLVSTGGLLLALTSWPVAGQSGQGCNADWPQVGTLRLDSPGPITVYRFANRATVGANNGAPICIDDTIPPRPQSGRIELLSGEPTLPLLANQAFNAPSRRRGILGWFRNIRLRSLLFRAGTAGSLGSDRVGFPLAALANGSAEISANHRRLSIPVNRVEIPLIVELWSPGARQPQVAHVEARSGEANFGPIRPQRGSWRVVIRAERPAVGGFNMVDRVSDPELSALATEQRLSPREADLALACIDLGRYGLEVYQRLEASPSDRMTVLSWQNPTVDLSCATPIMNSVPGR